MSQRGKPDPPTASLLLHPSNTGIAWTQATRNAILMPVSQMETGSGDPTKTNTPADKQFGTIDLQDDSSPVSQLQKPLRVITQKPRSSSSSELSNAPVTQDPHYSAPSQPIKSSQSGSLQYSIPFPNPPDNVTHASLPQDAPPSYSHPSSSYPTTVDFGPPPPVSQTVNFPPHVTVTSLPTSSSVPTIATTPMSQHTMGSGTTSPSVPEETPYPVAYTVQYNPVQAHWFYKKVIEKKDVWVPFSKLDSHNLEAAYAQGLHGAIIPTDGGRYDVHLGERKRKPIYWEEQPCDVQRCTWFYKPEGQQRFFPYDEEIANKIEDHYKLALTTNRWHLRLDIGSDSIVVHNPNVIVHFQPSSQPDEWGNVHEGQMRPRVVKRGVEDFENIDEGEPVQIDHLIFVVHGVGAVCDLRFRTIVECVDDIRSLALSLQQTHFKHHVDTGAVGRVEFLPVSWHGPLHKGTTGIDSRIKPITLSSIPKLRHFINDTLLDILFYTSPIYCQTIVDTVGSEINRLYNIFISKNPNFSGRVSLAGHSLGSLILFDILAHQLNPSSEALLHPEVNGVSSCGSNSTTNLASVVEPQEETPNTIDNLFRKLNIEEYVDKFHEERIDMDTLLACQENDLKELGIPMGPRKKLLTYIKEQEFKPPSQAISQEMNECSGDATNSKEHCDEQHVLGSAGTGQPCVSYPKLGFSPCCFFALGSPIGMFLTIRGIKTLGQDYKLPTCPAFFNIFHPFDPVAYRVETLIDPMLTVKPVLIPHHKGRKRMHLELKESLSRVGSDLKQKLIDSIRYTWNSLNEFARAHRFSAAQVEEEVDRVLEEELNKREETEESENSPISEEELKIGQLNGGRRIDYSLQEKPIESFNEYLFALGSHACYWESEDTVLMILKEVYAVQGIQPMRTPAVQLYNPSALRSHSLPTFTPLQEQTTPLPPPFQQEPFSRSSMLNMHETAQAAAPPPPSVPPTGAAQPLGPPPLQGFVKVSPLQRR